MIYRQELWLRSFLGWLYCMAVAGCSQSGTEIDVTVEFSQIAVPITGLQVTLQLGVRPASQPYSIDVTNSFVIRLQPSAAGALRVDLGGLGSDGCLIADGQSTLQVQDSQRHQLTIDLVPLNPKGCRLVWQAAGSGHGMVTPIINSGNEGTFCGQQCQTYRPGTVVDPNAHHGPRYRFSRVDGAMH